MKFTQCCQIGNHIFRSITHSNLFCRVTDASSYPDVWVTIHLPLDANTCDRSMESLKDPHPMVIIQLESEFQDFNGALK